jgi:hypothetical protein
MNPVRAVIRRFDSWLSDMQGVEPFTDDPHCILRVQVGVAPHTLILPDETVPGGAHVLMLHAWNEHMPSTHPKGPSLAYGSRLHRLMITSFRSVAQHILSTPSLHIIRAVGGVTAHVSPEKGRGGRVLLERLGFSVFPYHRPLGAFGEFWENFYTWWLIWTYNPASLRHRRLWELHRAEFWMTKARFLEQYG